MIEQSILEWIELNDSIQKIKIYNKNNLSLFVINYLLSKYSHFHVIFYYIVICLFFFQIIEINIAKIDINDDGLLKLLKYFENIFLFHKLIEDNKSIYLTFLIIIIIYYFLLLILTIINTILYIKKKKKYRFLLTINAIINILNIYYINGPAIKILFYKLLCYKEIKIYLCPINNLWSIFSLINFFIYTIFIICSSFAISFFYNDIGFINSSNVKCIINNNFTCIIVMIRLFYFICYYLIENFLNNYIIRNNNIIILIYNLFLLVFNIFISIYTYRKLYYYNHYINTLFHYGFYYLTWFSFCIFLKNLIQIKDITLFIILGLIIITIGFYYNNKNRYFKLITEFNIFEKNDLNNNEVYINLMMDLVKKKDHKSKLLIAGVVKRFEIYISNNEELLEQYNKLINAPYLYTKFPSNNELKVLSIIYIIYSYNIEKSKDAIDIALNMSYFLINKYKNPVYAIWLCTKLKTYSIKQAYYIYVLIEEIKNYLIDKIKKKNSLKMKIKNVQISSVILYYQFLNLFKIKIYDSICSTIEYYDILRNRIATKKTIDNYLKVGENILSLRKEIFILWDKIIILNPFSNESKNDFFLYSNFILQDNILVKNTEKKYNELQAAKLPEKYNIYYSMYNQENSAVLLADGNIFNGKILYSTPNFPYLFMFNEKEIINISIEDLVPNVIQNFHKYIIEEQIKYSNLNYIFKEQRNTFLKGKDDKLFNVKLYVKPVPNLCYGLIYFIYVQKIKEENFIILLDKNLLISGFTHTNEIIQNFNLGKNFDLSKFINGHHIGIIIPEILLYLDYDIKKNIFGFKKKHIDLKGYLYQIKSFKELDGKIPILLEKLRKRKIQEEKNENKFEIFEEYNELISLLNKQNLKPYSIFFRIEPYNFINGKYVYYRVYIINDMTNENKYLLDYNINLNNLSKNKDENQIVNINKYIISKKDIDSNYKIKELIKNNDYKSNNKKLNKENINLIKEKTKKTYKKSNNNSSNNKTNSNQINSFEKKENPFIESKNQKKNISSYQSNEQPVIFNKVKKQILIKSDCIHVKRMKYLSYVFVILNIILIVSDYLYIEFTTNKIFTFLKENIYFKNLKICSVSIYLSTVNLKFIKKGYIKNDICSDSNCSSFFIYILKKCLIEMSSEQNNIHYYYSDFKKIFREKIDTELVSYNITKNDNLSFDISNLVYFIASQGVELISNFKDDVFGNITNNKFLGAYMRNLMMISLKYFKSELNSFTGKEKEEKANKISYHYPLFFGIYTIYLIFTIYIYSSYIIMIKDIHIFYFSKLMNFISEKFELYLQKIKEIKKKFGQERKEEEDDDDKIDNNLEDFNFRDEKEEKNKKNQDFNQKNEQSKIIKQKLKNKIIISNYLCKLNIYFISIFGIIFLFSILYYITSILINRKLKKNYIEFDNEIEKINNLYLDCFKIFSSFKEELEKFEGTENKSKLEIPSDNEIIRPKFGNSILILGKNSKYSKGNLVIFNKLYSGNACEILVQKELEIKICQNILSSILNKGLEEAIIQVNNVMITKIIDELNSLNNNKTLYQIYNEFTSFSDYELFMNYIMVVAFFKTQNILNDFRQDEKLYINKINRIILISFFFFYDILFFFLLYYIYSYKSFTGQFLSFIGIIPPKYIADDNEFYSQVIGLAPFY